YRKSTATLLLLLGVGSSLPSRECREDERGPPEIRHRAEEGEDRRPGEFRRRGLLCGALAHGHPINARLEQVPLQPQATVRGCHRGFQRVGDRRWVRPVPRCRLRLPPERPLRLQGVVEAGPRGRTGDSLHHSRPRPGIRARPEAAWFHGEVARVLPELPLRLSPGSLALPSLVAYPWDK